MKLLSRKYSLASVLTKVQVAFGIEDHHCDGTLNRGWIRRVVSSNLSLWNISMHKNDHFGKKHVWKPKCTNVVLFKPNYLVCFYKTLMKCLWHETECNGFERVCFLFILQKYSGLIPCCWLVVKWQFRLREPLFPWRWSLWSVQVGSDCPNWLPQLFGILLHVPSAPRRGQVSLACGTPFFPWCQAAALCSFFFVLCPASWNQSLVSHLERLNCFHINTSRACEIKLLGNCSEQTKQGWTNQGGGGQIKG